MKKTLAFMIMAAALLLTQCKKPSIKFPTPSVTTTVSMTITAGPGSKTDISTMGGIVWSENDKIYVGDGSKYVGYLSITSGVGNATGTFTGDVTATTGTHTFHFYYLGSSDYTGSLASGTSTTVDVDFSSQNIYEENGKLKNASGQHVGYGKAENVEVETDKPVMGLEVTMKSKVAIAYFCFQKGEGESANPYTDALTLSGDHIYNKMTVNFGANDFSFSGTKGDISLTNTMTHLKYAMLVPAGTSAATLNFGGGDVTGATALENGIEANKFYRIDDSMPIVVTVKPIEFTVDANGTKVKFAPGNLQYLGQAEEGHKWRFAEHQWDYMGDGPASGTTKQGNVDLGDEYAGKYNTGSGNAGGSETEADKASARDLFGWGATGYQDTRDNASTHQTNYQPYSTSKTKAKSGTEAYKKNCYGYGPDYNSGTEYGLTVAAKSDWGCLAIGADPAGTWRTLSSAEWAYLLNTGNAESGARTDANRFAKARVNDVNGMLIFPDGYSGTASGDGIATVNSISEGYPSENIPDGTWTSMETAGVVFLPVAGSRLGSSLDNVGSYGYYWSSPCRSSYGAYDMVFSSSDVDPQYYNDRCRGCSVRLVR